MNQSDTLTAQFRTLSRFEFETSRFLNLNLFIFYIIKMFVLVTIPGCVYIEVDGAMCAWKKILYFA